MSKQHLDYEDVRSWLKEHINDERVNPVKDDVCRYTDEHNRDWHCIGGQYLTERGLPLPMETANIICDYSGHGAILLNAAQYVADGRGFRSYGDTNPDFQFFKSDFKANNNGEEYEVSTMPRIWKDALALLNLDVPVDQVRVY